MPEDWRPSVEKQPNVPSLLWEILGQALQSLAGGQLVGVSSFATLLWHVGITIENLPT